ncbi:MAG: hypothetical protein ACRBN8_09565 [Nannocystales bacterium]
MLRRHDALGLIATHKNLVASMHWGRTTLGHVDELAQSVAELVRLHERFVTVVVVTGADLMHAPDPATRARLRQLVEDTAQTGLGTAFVVTRGGFLGSAVVSLLSGLFVLSRSREPNRAFRTTTAAAPWLQDLLTDGAPPWQPGEVARTLETITALRAAG